METSISSLGGDFVEIIHELLSDAIKSGNEVEIVYKKSKTEEETRIIQPYALVNFAPYVVGFCTSRNEMRIFKLNKISKVESLNNKFQIRIELFKDKCELSNVVMGEDGENVYIGHPKVEEWISERSKSKALIMEEMERIEDVKRKERKKMLEEKKAIEEDEKKRKFIECKRNAVKEEIYKTLCSEYAVNCEKYMNERGVIKFNGNHEIEYVFDKYDGPIFIDFCKLKGIEFVNQIDSDILEEFAEETIDEYAIRSITSQLAQYYIEEDFFEKEEIKEEIRAEVRHECERRIERNIWRMWPKKKLFVRSYIKYKYASEKICNDILDVTYGNKLVRFYGFERVEDAFKDKIFQKFITYCKDNGIEKVGEITSDTIIGFYEIKGTRKSNIEEIINLLVENHSKESFQKRQGEFFSWREYTEIFREYSVGEIFDSLGIEYCLDKNNKIILEGRTRSDLEKDFGYEISNYLFECSKHIKDPRTLIAEADGLIYERIREIFKLKHEDNWTYTSISKEYDVTACRIRSLMTKGINNIMRHLKNSRFDLMIKLFRRGKEYITEKEMNVLLGEDYLYMAGLFKKKNPFMIYSKGDKCYKIIKAY